MNDRLLSFDSIENFRDYGGYAGAEGLVARDRLYRSGQHSRASDSDVKSVEALGLTTIVDLRRTSERLKDPSRLPQGWSGQMFTSDLGGEGVAPHIRFLMEQDLTPDSGRRYMAGTYARMPFEPTHIELFKAHFQALAKGQGASLIHCAAGKDRTGLLAALTHKVLGVSDDDLIADYLETNRAVRLEERADKFAEWLFRQSGKRASADAVIAFFGVEPSFIDGAWQAMAEHNGGVEQYLQQVLGVDEAMTRLIRERMTT